MTLLCSSVVWIVFSFVWTFTSGDIAVSCQFRENCILPCMFTPGDEPVIHWLKGETETKVHTYYHQNDQLALQAQSFKDRTSLFKDQISRGNASLLLTGPTLQDQARYKCYTSTIKGHQDSFVNLKVEAPVSKVHIKKAEGTITCSSEDIYPEPQLGWSTDPPSDINHMSPTTTVLRTEQQLYSIKSSLMLLDNTADMSVSCTVSTHASKKKATLLATSSNVESDAETTISCTASDTPYTFLIWRFNNSQLILTHSRPESYRPAKEWEKHVKALSETGSLTLEGLSSENIGMYTCELSNDENTYIKNTLLQIQEGSQNNVASVAIPVVIVLIVFGVIGIVIYRKSCKKQNGHKSVPVKAEEEMDDMKRNP